MKVALYARVSTAEEKELQDPETQLVILRDWVGSNGHEVIREYVDHASGKSAEGREQFKDMVMAAERKEVQAVVILRLDRFMRDAVEGMAYTKRLQAAGCALVLVKDNILGHVDTSTSLGEFFLTMIFAIGQLERRQTNERTREGISRFKRQKGYWGAGKNRRKDINVQMATECLKIMSLSETARLLEVPRNTLREHLKREGVDIETLEACRNTSPKKSPSA